MNVAQYLFQSPSPQQVQIGRPDPTVSKETQTESQENLESSSQTTQKIADLETQKVQNPLSSSPEHLLDLYV